MMTFSIFRKILTNFWCHKEFYQKSIITFKLSTISWLLTRFLNLNHSLVCEWIKQYLSLLVSWCTSRLTTGTLEDASSTSSTEPQWSIEHLIRTTTCIRARKTSTSLQLQWAARDMILPILWIFFMRAAQPMLAWKENTSERNVWDQYYNTL